MTTTAAPSRRGSLAKMEARQALGFASPALVGLCLFTIVPVVLSIVMSFFDWPTFGERTFNGGANYARLLDDPNFLPALRNSLVFTVLYVPTNIILSLLLAIGLGPRIRGRAALRVLFFIPVVTPMVANVLVWKMLLQPQGLFNGIAISWFGVELPNFLADSAPGRDSGLSSRTSPFTSRQPCSCCPWSMPSSRPSSRTARCSPCRPG